MNRISLHVITISNGLFMRTSPESKKRENNSQFFLFESFDWKFLQILIHCYYNVILTVVVMFIILNYMQLDRAS